MIDYSIIIPHKNIPNLLKRCIESIPSRRDIEVIVVDDNSDKAVIDKLHGINRTDIEYNIFFLTEAKSAGAARNEGLKHARGKYVTFIDADDFLSDKADLIFTKYKNTNYDLVFFYFDSVYSDTLEPADRHLYFNEKFNQCKLLGNYDVVRYKSNSPVAKFIRREMIVKNNIQFDEIKYSNDVMFSLKCGCVADSIYIDDEVLYIVTIRSGSLVTAVTKESLRMRFDVAIKNNNVLKDIGKYVYHVNLFAYLNSAIKVGIGDFLFVLIKSLSNTPLKYIFKDIYNCFLFLIRSK